MKVIILAALLSAAAFSAPIADLGSALHIGQGDAARVAIGSHRIRTTARAALRGDLMNHNVVRDCQRCGEEDAVVNRGSAPGRATAVRRSGSRGRESPQCRVQDGELDLERELQIEMVEVLESVRREREDEPPRSSAGVEPVSSRTSRNAATPLEQLTVE